jgi:hypothetical protein
MSKIFRKNFKRKYVLQNNQHLHRMTMITPPVNAFLVPSCKKLLFFEILMILSLSDINHEIYYHHLLHSRDIIPRIRTPNSNLFSNKIIVGHILYFFISSNTIYTDILSHPIKRKGEGYHSGFRKIT